MKPFKLLFSALITLCVYMVVLSEASSLKHYYPKSVIEYEVRRDLYTNDTVSRGRLHLVNYDISLDGMKVGDELKKNMVNFATFQRHLQCASPEPELDGNRGSWSLIQMAPPTKQSIQHICAWAESNCHPWAECKMKAEDMKNGKYDHSKASDIFVRMWGGFKDPNLLRVINNSLHYDWPWGIERFKENDREFRSRILDHYSILDTVVHIISDIGDSVFLFGLERSFLPWNLPFPMFSFAPSLSSADLPYPWPESYRLERKTYIVAQKANNFSDAFYRREHRAWHSRESRAAFFATFTPFRQVAFDSAVLRPDLFDMSCAQDDIKPWNPLSDEPSQPRPWDIKPKKNKSADKTDTQNHPGFIEPILKFGDARTYIPQNYKYIIVPTGMGDQSTSGRLAGLLAHSGAVILLQENSFSYHFSARLEPWVHYVPLSHSMADVIDKVLWLKRNDDMARQIAKNAQNFALSYLRLEDYLCYAAGSLRLLHDLEKTTDALESFSPVEIKRGTR